MTRDVSTDPVTQELLHVDLYRVFEDKEIEVKIPFRVRGRAIGVVQGGILNVTRHYLPVRTTPAKMPASIDVDVTDLDLKQTISLEDLEFPEGVECTLPRKLTLVIVLEARLVVEEEPTVEAAEAAPGEVAEGAAEPEAPEAAAAEDEKASS